MINKKKKLKIHFTVLFFIGLFIFSVGVFGYTFRLFSWVPVNLDEVLPKETAFVTKIHLNKIKNEQDTLNLQEFVSRLDEYLEKKFTINFTKNIKPWIGSKASFSILDEGEYLWAIERRNKKESQKFLEEFITNGEKFVEQELENGKLLTPEFSSDIAFGFYHNWLLVSPSQAAIKKVFTKEFSLQENEKYKKIITDIPQNNFIFSFANTDLLLDHIKIPESFKKYSPLAKTIAQSLPHVGVSLQYEKEQITVSTKILSQEGVFKERLVSKTPNQTMPELAHMIPKDILFFTNGSDLYAKYLHTKEFLSELDPQFSIIFEGLLQAQSEKIFGENFQFEQDFLSKMRGQYAFALNFEDVLKPFINFTFITGFGYENKTEDISQFHDAIHLAQTQFSPKIEVVELPDGTTRKELVSAKPEEIAIEKIEFSNHTFFANHDKTTQQQFAYGFFDKNLVFSTHTEGLKSIISIIEDKNESLAENADFRESVLFKFSPSESYGFLNISKLVPSLELWQNQKESNSLTTFLRSKFRNFTFSRKIFPGEIFIKGIFFKR